MLAPRTTSPVGNDPLARVLRPYWFVCWVSLGYAALVLVPTILPVYGAVLPLAHWAGVVLQFSAFAVPGARAWVRRDPAASLWLAAAAAGLGTEVVYAAGAVALLTTSFTLADYVAIGFFGIASLFTLVLLERWAFAQSLSPPTPNRGGP